MSKLTSAKSVAILVTAVCAGVLIFHARGGSDSRQTATAEQRAKAVAKAAEARLQDKSWPDTPEALIADFWNAASRKDYQRLLVLCPGAVAGDFKVYEQWTPSPAKQISALPADPAKPGLQLFAVKVPFPHFPDKTIKMAIRKDSRELLIVDGGSTVWW